MKDKDSVRTDSINVLLGDQQEVVVALKNHVVLEPIMKLVDGFWMGATHDISMKYSEDFTKLHLKNYTGCVTPLELRIRLIKVENKTTTR